MRAMFGGNIVSGEGYASAGPGPEPGMALPNHWSTPFGSTPRKMTRSPSGGFTGGPLASVLMGGTGGPASDPAGGSAASTPPPVPPLPETSFVGRDFASPPQAPRA